MKTPVLRARSVASLLAAALASCSHSPEPKAAEPPPKPTAAEQSQKSFQLATQEQQALTEQLKRVEAAHKNAIAAQQQLAQAQALEQQERAKAQQLQEQASRHLRETVQHAQQAQAGVAGMGATLEGMQTTAGRVTQAAPSHVILRMQSGQAMTFDVDARTRVLVGTDEHPIAVTDIQQGADAQVAYDPRGGRMTALIIRLAPAAPGGAASPQEPSEPSR